MRIRKTYRGTSADMVRDEMLYALQKAGVDAGEAITQTYAVPSGQTQSRITIPLVTSNQKPCGSLHLVGAARGETRVSLDLDDSVVNEESRSSLEEELEFLLGIYEVKW